MKSSIYTINNGAEVAYQKGSSRVVFGKIGRRHEVKERGEWRQARGYFKPNFVETVRAALRKNVA